MANIARLQIDLSGAGVVGPSVITLYEDAAVAGLPAATVTLLNSIKNTFPDDLTFTVPGGGDTFDVATGTLNGTWSDGGGGTVAGTDAGAFALGSGYRVKYSTAGIVNGRRVRGSTFFVPCAGLIWATNGRMVPASATSIQTALTTFMAAVSGKLVVWSRPTATRSGTMHPVTLATVSTTPTQLRSRRV